MKATDYDAVVIGSGAGGGACAWALCQGGARVLLLEAGPAYDPDRDYHLASSDWERQRFPAKVPIRGRQSFAPLQLLEERWRQLRSWSRLRGPMVAGNRRQVWGYQHVIGLGGSTLHFTGEAHRLHPRAMKMASRFGVAADWPLDYAELEPFYLEVERLVGVAGPAVDGHRPRSAPYPLPAHPLSHATRTLVEGSRRLGLDWTANALASLSRPYDGRPGCNYCGQCNRGCPRRDKGSVDITFIPKAVATGRCTVATGCRVLRLEPGPDDRVAWAEYLDVQGRLQRVAAPLYALACGAVETPRLLLNSAASRAPQGLANESGQVGRHFMETLYWTSSALHPDRLGSHRGLPADGICWDFNAPDAIPGVVGGCRFTPTVAEADLAGPLAYARRVVGGWGRAHKAGMRATFGRVLSVGAIGENLPHPGSFIDLDPDGVDDQGMPLARIHAYLDEAELTRLSFMAQTCRRILQACGVEELFEEYGSFDAFNATHVFGTCRMGTDPDRSVVNRYGRSHRWRNLFIVDASVFPSSGGGEAPSLTIEALAVRSARRMLSFAGGSGRVG